MKRTYVDEHLWLKSSLTYGDVMLSGTLSCFIRATKPISDCELPDCFEVGTITYSAVVVLYS